MDCPNCGSDQLRPVDILLLDEKDPHSDSGHAEIEGFYFCTDCYCTQDEA